MRIAGSILLLLAAAPAFGGLGGPAMSVATDQPGMMVVRRAVPARSYTVQEVKTQDGTVVREYVSAEGKVFGVAWNGAIMPDLQQLFGEYFTIFQSETRSRGQARGTLRIDRPDLVVQSGGHMRAYSGRAYVPQLLPAGVTAAEIK
jgi:hypothetical protein